MNTWHPLVAPLTEALVRDGDEIVIASAALSSVVGRASGCSAAEKQTVALHVAALAKLVWQGRGRLRVDGAVQALAQACVSILGDARRAADVIESVSRAVSDALGARLRATAPRAPVVAAPQNVRPTRGLRR